jgi:hypothetical protein
MGVNFQRLDGDDPVEWQICGCRLAQPLSFTIGENGLARVVSNHCNCNLPLIVMRRRRTTLQRVPQ